MHHVYYYARGLPRACADTLIKWARENLDGEISAELPSYRIMLKYCMDRNEDRVGSGCRYRTTVVEAEDPFCPGENVRVEFECRDIMDAAVSLLTEGLVSSRADLLLTQRVRWHRTRGRMYGPNLNEGVWWERTENEVLGGKQAHDSRVALLPLLVFIDGTCPVKKGNLSICPIMVTLGSFPANVRSKPVSSNDNN